jgi:hypothetical protein
MAGQEHIDHVLRNWPYEPDAVGVRITRGADGREVIQMRVDLGLLQLEVDGRPDGARPGGFETYYDYLLSLKLHASNPFVLSEQQCGEIDREFVQFYHRRICWLKLQAYRQAVQDADHTLALMAFCRSHSADDQWTMTHEQYRPFVLFHRTQAAALAELEEAGAEAAVQEINEGLRRMGEFFAEHDAQEQFEDDELAKRLKELRESLRREYGVGRTLQERLADAVAAEQYELAARLRDELARRGGAGR